MNESTQELRWRRARQCSSGNCVEIAHDGDHILLRDSKKPRTAPMVFTHDEWAAFTSGVRAGEFDFG